MTARIAGRAGSGGSAGTVVVRWLGVAHMVNDLNQAAVVGVVPFLIAHRGLSFTAASGLVMATTITAVVVQPALGHVIDRRAARGGYEVGRTAPAMLLAGAAAVAAIGVPHTPAALAVVILVLGAVTAAFHPEAMRALAAVSGPRGTTALAWFAVCGHLGTALGPVSAAGLVSALGLPGLAVLIAPSLVVAHRLTRLRVGVVRGSRPVAAAAPGPARWCALARMVGVLVLRSALVSFATTFVPVLLVRRDAMSVAYAGLVATVMLLAGVVAAPIAARLAERHGARGVLIAMLVTVGPLLWGGVQLGGAPGLACLVLAGVGMVAPYSVALSTALACLPGREGLAAGVAMGVSSLGSLGLLGLGALADAAGLTTAFLVAAALPVISAGLAAWPHAVRGPTFAAHRSAR